MSVSTFETLTTESGGYVEALRDPIEIPAAVARICDDLQSQYLLAIARGQADGKYHSIQVRTKDRRLRVRARGLRGAARVNQVAPGGTRHRIAAVRIWIRLAVARR